jgi:hypothetical protein
MMNTRRLLSATAVLYWLIAFMKIFATHTFYALSGIDITEQVATIPEAERAAFIGLPDDPGKPGICSNCSPVSKNLPSARPPAAAKHPLGF